MIPPRGGDGTYRPASGECLQHRKVGRSWFVQSRQHRVHGPYAALRGYEEVGPAFSWMGHAVLVCDGLQSAHYGRPDGHDPASRRACSVDRAGGLGRDTVELLVGRLVVFEAGYARVKYERYDLDSLRDEARDELRGERPSCGRHLGATHLRCVNRLVVARRPALPDVAVPDRSPVPLQIFINVHRQVKGRDPE